MKKVFRETLLLPQEYPTGFLPSPNDLVYKILVKGKRAKLSTVVEVDDEEEEEQEDEDEKEANENNKKLYERKKMAMAKSKRPKTDKHAAIHPDLSAVVFLGTTHAKSLDAQASDAVACDLMTSFSEIKTLKQLKKPELVKDWIKYNRKHLR